MLDADLDALFARSDLDAGVRLLSLAMAALCRKDETLLRALGDRSESVGVSGGELREMCLQGLLYAGFPRALTAYEILSPWLGSGDGRHVDTETSFEDGRARGEALFAEIYGSVTDRVHAKLEALDPAALEFVLGFAYGRVLCRPELPLNTRELLAVAALSVLDQKPQLLAHARGAQHAGAGKDQVLEAAATVALVYEDVRRLEHRELLASFLAPRS